MRLPKLTIATTLLSCGLTVAFLYHLHARKSGEHAWFSMQNDRMRYDAYVRHQAAMSAHADKPKTKTEQTNGALASAPGAAPEAGAALPPTATTGARYGYHNAGQGTPAAALQSFVWACDLRDPQSVARMLYLEPEERRKAEQFLASLPAEVRAKWASVEDLGAHLLILSSLARSFPSSDVLAAAPVEMQGEDRALCGVAQRVAFRKVDGEWRRELTADTIEHLQREATLALSAQASH